MTKLKHIDLFVLDVEGHELEAIEGMRNTSIRPDIICVEHINIEADLTLIMKELGYRLDRVIHVNSYFVKE